MRKKEFYPSNFALFWESFDFLNSFSGSVLIPADTTQAVTILLKRNSYRMKPSSCQRVVDTVQMAPYDAIPIMGLPGTQYAFLIRDSLLRQPHKLKAIKYPSGNN